MPTDEGRRIAFSFDGVRFDPEHDMLDFRFTGDPEEVAAAGADINDYNAMLRKIKFRSAPPLDKKLMSVFYYREEPSLSTFPSHLYHAHHYIMQKRPDIKEYKINVAFDYVLYNNITKRERHFWARTMNTNIFNKSKTVSTVDDIARHMNEFQGRHTTLEEAVRDRSNDLKEGSHWSFVRFTGAKIVGYFRRPQDA